MNLHDTEIPLGRLVAEHPHLIRTLEGLGLDYCCGGHRPLSQAVAEKGLNLEEVLAALKQALASTQDACAAPWLEKTCSELIDHIVRSHHGFLRTELPRLSSLTDKVFEVHVSRAPELGELRRVMAGFREEIESHLAKEEQILFPAIVACETRGDGHAPGSRSPGPRSDLLHGERARRGWRRPGRDAPADRGLLSSRSSLQLVAGPLPGPGGTRAGHAPAHP